ncbi:MAG: DUF4136 domain-containing protein [Thermaurantiacus sp.]
MMNRFESSFEVLRQRQFNPLAAAVALLLLSACATPFQATLTRYHAPEGLAPGQSFVVAPANPDRADSLEFATYAAHLSRNLVAKGFREAASAEQADLVARFAYGIGPPRDRIGTRPGPAFSSWGWYGRPFWGPGWHPWIGSRFYDPFWGTGFGPTEVYSFTEFPAFAELDIAPAQGRRNVFEGRAESASRQGGAPGVVPKLIDALFVDFPGTSGEVRRVQVADER